MQNQFTENWNKLCQCVNKPLNELTELNINTLQNWAKNKGHLEELTQAKKPEDFFATQQKLATIGQLDAMSYAKKASDIWVKAIDEIREIYSDITRETSIKTSEGSRTKDKSKE